MLSVHIKTRTILHSIALSETSSVTMGTMKLLLLLSFVVSAFADCRSGKLLDGDVRGLPSTIITTTPYLVSLEYKGKHFCSGAAVAKQIAVTSARCVIGLNEADLSLRSGSASSLAGGKKHQVKEIIVHPDYNPTNLDYDVAIIKITSSKKFSSPISMASSKPLLNTAATYGWPLKSSLLDPWVRHVNAPLVANKNCASSYGIEIGDSMLCAGLSTSLHCQGDAGGPLVGSNKLVGIASFGYGCSKSAPGIYTSIPVVRKWIKSYT